MRVISTLILLLLMLPGFSQNKRLKEIPGIFDTVYFDYDSVSNGSFSLIVSMFSPASVNSMDFSIRLNINNIEFDTLNILTSNIEGTAFYNEADSTVRFTSFSLQNYQTKTPLVRLSFTSSYPVTFQDFIAIKSYLNGEAASPLLRFPTTGIFDHQIIRNLPVFPNPCISKISFDAENPGVLCLIDENGSVCKENIPVNRGLNTIPMTGLSDGVYFVVLQSANQRQVCKLLKNRNIN